MMLYGVTAFLQDVPRYSSVYRHLGIIDYLVVHGSVDQGIDAYFNWPGIFAAGLLLMQAMGVDPITVTPWAPLFFSLVFLGPRTMIFRWASDDPRVTWLGLWVFYSANWVGQDTFAPQAVVHDAADDARGAADVVHAASGRERAGPAWRGLLELLNVTRMRSRLRREALGIAHRGSAARRPGMLLVVVLIYAAIVSGHQLTPFPALAAVTLLVSFAGLETRRLPIIMIASRERGSATRRRRSSSGTSAC